MTETQIRYTELTQQDINPRLVWGVNVLLPQLSASARPVTEEWLERVFENGTRLFAAYDGDRLVGVTLLVPTFLLVGRKDWIEDVAVDKDYRRRGIGSRLMDMAEEASRLGKPKHINLTSSTDRGGARTMYERRGYALRSTGVYRKML